MVKGSGGKPIKRFNFTGLTVDLTGLSGRKDFSLVLKPVLERLKKFEEGVFLVKVRVRVYEKPSEKLDNIVFNLLVTTFRNGVSLRTLKNRVRKCYAPLLSRNQSLVYRVRKQYLLRQLKRMLKTGLILIENEEPFRDMLKALRKKDAEKLNELWKGYADEIIVKPRVEVVKAVCRSRRVIKEILVIKEKGRIVVKYLLPEPLTFEEGIS